MRTLRFMSTALTLALLGLPGAVATASSAAAAEPVSTTVSIQLSRSSMRYAETFTVRGQVVATLSDGTEGWVDNASVALQRRLPGRSWRTIAQTTTSDTDGEYRFTSVRAQQNAGYRATYAGETRTYPDGDLTFSPSTSATRTIRVARAFDLSSAKRNGQIYLKGRVLPRYAGRVVYVQRRTCHKCAWKPWTRVRTNRYSRFSLRVGVPRSGAWDYRVRTPKSTAFIASSSSQYLTVYRY